MTVEIISWSITTKVWDRAGIELATPGSAVRHILGLYLSLTEQNGCYSFYDVGCYPGMNKNWYFVETLYMYMYSMKLCKLATSFYDVGCYPGMNKNWYFVETLYMYMYLMKLCKLTTSFFDVGCYPGMNKNWYFVEKLYIYMYSMKLCKLTTSCNHHGYW